MSTVRLAPAKVNLFLHVSAPDHRGYHPLETLVSFCDFGDELSFEPETNSFLSLSIGGPFAEGLSANEDNLVLRAVNAFERHTEARVFGKVHLTKNLPVASGIGGGSSDAGAMLHILRDYYLPNLPDNELDTIAASLGADGAMCLWGRSCLATNYGEVLKSASLPRVPIVLINPLVACSTHDIFKAYDQCGQFSYLTENMYKINHINIDEYFDYLKKTRNDLVSVACQKLPIISEILSRLEASPQAQISRMSGSGATCFALCRTYDDCLALANSLKTLWPEMWIQSGLLG